MIAGEAKVLVVEDEPDFRNLVAHELGEEGYGVSVACDGLAAMTCLAETEYDVVVTDVRMPGASGIDVLRAARTRTPDTEIVVTSGYASLDLAVECLRAGAFDFVQKPFNVVDLVSTVGRAVERRRHRTMRELVQAGQAVLATQEIERLPEVIVEVARRAMEADDASLMLPDSEGHLYVAYSSSLLAEVRAAVVGEERVASRIARQREPVLLLNGLGGDPRFSDIKDYKRVSSSIVYPLLAGERLVGVLNLNRADPDHPFRRGDVDRASVLASQALLALENSRLLRQMVASERLASIGQLAASVAHEINNPVSYVLSSHEFLHQCLGRLEKLGNVLNAEPVGSPAREAWRQAGGAEFLKDVFQATDDLAEGVGRIRNIVFDLRGLARTEDVPVVVDINDALRSALRVAATEIRHRSVVTDLGPDTLAMGISGRLSQVFLNLLVNAAQAITERNDNNGEIRISTRREGNQVLAEIANNGPPIAPGHLPRIFEPFFTTKSQTVGTGLGLSTSREIVRRLGGEIRVESSAATGTRFTVALPAAPLGRAPSLTAPPAR
ncbi:MAG TPA: response regulator [Polyangia bacterium]|nr:response regulator [Polyangia bacterium]